MICGQRLPCGSTSWARRLLPSRRLLGSTRWVRISIGRAAVTTVTGAVTLPERSSDTLSTKKREEDRREANQPGAGHASPTIGGLDIVGGLATAALGPAFVWRFVLHPRPGERFDLWFGVLAAALLVGLCVLAVIGGVRAWRRTPQRAWPLQLIAGLVVLFLASPRSPAPLLLLAALLAFLDAQASGTPAPPTPRTPSPTTQSDGSPHKE